MFLHLYKGKNSGKYRFKILNSSKRTIIKSKERFQSKKLREKFIKSLFNNSSNLKSVTKHVSKKGLYYFSIHDKAGVVLARSKKYKTKRKRNLRRKEFLSGIKKLDSKPTKKNKKLVEKERQILKTGKYPLGNYDYSIFLSSNGKHYFTFKSSDGKTALLNSNIQGFKTLGEAEEKLEEVIASATDKNLYEIKETKNGKFFFYLHNTADQKIAKSFFHTNKEDAERIISKFIGNKPKVKVETKKKKPTIAVTPLATKAENTKQAESPKQVESPKVSEVTKISTPVEKTEKIDTSNDLLTDREKYLRQKEADKIKLERELEERREKRRIER